VQAVEDYLNYTKLNYFSLLKLGGWRLEKAAKAGGDLFFAHLP
jgi:hypothetical protein